MERDKMSEKKSKLAIENKDWSTKRSWKTSEARWRNDSDKHVQGAVSVFESDEFMDVNDKWLRILTQPKANSRSAEKSRLSKDKKWNTDSFVWVI